MSRGIEFVTSSTDAPNVDDGGGLSLCCAYPIIDGPGKGNSMVTADHVNPRTLCIRDTYSEDGLYTDSNNMLTKTVSKPCRISRSGVNKTKSTKGNRLLDILIYDVNIKPGEVASMSGSESSIKVTSVAILYKKKVICRTTNLLDKQLYKLLLRDSSESSNLFVQVQLKDGSSSVLPLPLPKYSVTNKRIEIDFSVTTSNDTVLSGIVTCIVSLAHQGSEPSNSRSYQFFAPNNDPNDPRNVLSGRSVSREGERSEKVDHFTLDHPALCFEGEVPPRRVVRKKLVGPRDVEDVIVEPASFDHGDVTLKNWFQARRPLRPSAKGRSRKFPGSRKEALVVTVLRGIEVPVREESALVQPVLEIAWGDSVHATSPSDGPAPVWHETFAFEVPRENVDRSIELRLYDQHPVWGLQWLGEARIPTECHRDYQELERWVTLSPLVSPTMSLGYLEAGPGQSRTRIYILMKMDHPGKSRSVDRSSIDTLSRTIQRCINVPYKLEGIETSRDASRLSMFVTSLPNSYGPLTPKQALTLNRVDHFGRAALLTSLFRGLGLCSAVILGSSQTRKSAAFVLTIDESGVVVVWDPENGEHYDLGDNACSLTEVSRLINHENIFVNNQRNTTLLTLKFDVRSVRDWRPLNRCNETVVSREPEVLELKDGPIVESEEDFALSTEDHLKDKINEWRAAESVTTVWNRHAVTVLRALLEKRREPSTGHPDKKELKQLCRAYHVHGFLVNLRRSSVTELSEQLRSTKIHRTVGPVEFALACRVQRYVGIAHSLWLAVIVLKIRE